MHIHYLLCLIFLIALLCRVVNVANKQQTNCVGLYARVLCVCVYATIPGTAQWWILNVGISKDLFHCGIIMDYMCTISHVFLLRCWTKLVARHGDISFEAVAKWKLTFIIITSWKFQHIKFIRKWKIIRLNAQKASRKPFSISNIVCYVACKCVLWFNDGKQGISYCFPFPVIK